MVGLSVKKNVINEIKNHEKKLFNKNKEIGGWLVVDEDTITNVYFDEDVQSVGYVKFGCGVNVVPKDERNKVKGWFHKHPIMGLSGMDINTSYNLTKFWGECYTLVLQSNNTLLLIKTKIKTDFILNTPVVIVQDKLTIDMVNE